VIFSQSAFAQISDSAEPAPFENTSPEKISTDGSIKVNIDSNLPKADSSLIINLRFSDTATGIDLSNVNYDIIAMQNGEVVLSQLGLYAENGRAQHITSTLSTDNHVEIMVILQGIGQSAPYTGPHGEMIEFTIVPEFGVFVLVVMLLGITSTVVLQKIKRLE
jgi:hypothetical protein